MPATAVERAIAALRAGRPVAVGKVTILSVETATEAILDLLDPEIAVVSVGRDNDYGHPTQSTMATLGGFSDLDVYRTDLDGRVTIETDGSRVSVRPER